MQADKIFSKVTVTSGRTLLSIAAIIIASWFFDFELKSLPLIAQSGLNDEQLLLKLAIPLIMFLCVAHFINWSTDHNGHVLEYLKKGGKLIENMDMDDKSLNDKGYSAFDRWFNSQNNKGLRRKANLASVEGAEKRLTDLEGYLKAFGRWTGYFRIYAHRTELVSVYVQHLLLPIGAGIWAILIAYGRLA